MNKRETLELLDRLISEIQGMSDEEFAERERQLGVDKITYNPMNYLPDCTRPEDTGCHAHSGMKCCNMFQCGSGK